MSTTTIPQFTPRQIQPVSFPVMEILKSARFHLVNDVHGVTLAQAIGELIAAKRTSGRRDNYIESLEYYLGRFAKGRESKPIADIQVFEIDIWLSQFTAAYSRQTWFNRVNTLFSFSLRRGWVEKNPCDRIDRMAVDKKAPFILSPEQADKMLAMTTAIMRPYIILGLYAGVRPQELLHVQWEQIDLQAATLRLDFTKTRRRRIVPLEPKAVALLAACPNRAGWLAPSSITTRRFKRAAARAFGWQQWPMDLLRHTAASYLLALIGDAGKVAMRLGNSAQILLTHYYQLVKKEDCERFWAVNDQPTTN